MRGEFYNSIHDIVSQQDAWDMILCGDDFMMEAYLKHGYGVTDEQIEDLEKHWQNAGISHYEGFFLRSDGMVELAED